MGLRINTNVSAMRALRNLGINDRNQNKSLERLSTGLRINRGSDDPSGLIVSELLRGQIRMLDQAVSNSQNASNLISIADAALQEASDLLISIQDSIVFAMNTGGASPDQIAAEQDAVDSAIQAVDRIANTTRYGDRTLLNGNSDYQLLQSVPVDGSNRPYLQNLTMRSISFPPGSTQTALSVSVTVNPQRAALRITAPTAAAGATIRITGARGTTDVTFASGATVAQMAAGINTASGITGVYASGTANLLLRSEDFGLSQLIKLEVVSGSLAGTAFETQDNSSNIGAYAAFSPAVGATMVAGEVINDRGRDGQVAYDGHVFTGVGNHFSVLSSQASFEFDLNPDVITTVDSSIAALAAAGAAQSVTYGKTGLTFQLNELPRPTDTLEIGLQGINTTKLGFDTTVDRIAEAMENYNASTATINRGGYLNTVRTGGGNDLTQNPTNALSIIRKSINQVGSLRGYLGAVQHDSIDPNTRELGVEIENLSASLSDLRDLDFAEETAAFTRNQILFQSGIAVMASANLIPQSVLTLLS